MEWQMKNKQERTCIMHIVCIKKNLDVLKRFLYVNDFRYAMRHSDFALWEIQRFKNTK